MDEAYILVVDDCRLTRTIAADLLGQAGFAVASVGSALEANTFLYGGRPPAVVLMDVVMPMLGGDRKLQRMRRQQDGPAIPVLLISTKPEGELAALAAAAGADGYVPKPFVPERLLREVRRFC